MPTLRDECVRHPVVHPAGLVDLGIDEKLDDGTFLPRKERIQEVQSKASAGHDGEPSMGHDGEPSMGH